MGRFSKLEWEPDKKSGKKDSQVKEKPDSKSSLPESQEEAEIYDYYHYLKKAESLYFTGDYRTALRQYSRALQMDNSQIDPWVGQVMCLVAIKQIKEADLWIARGLELFPDNPQLLSIRGLIYAINGMVKRGIATSDYALTIKNSNLPLVWIIRGEILLIGDSKNSAICFEKAIEIASKSDWQTPMAIGIAYFKHKYFTQASQYFQKACSINLSHYYLWYYLGLSYQKLGFTQKAIEAFKRSIELKPDFKDGNNALYNLTHKSILKQIYQLPILPFILIKKIFVGHKIKNI